MSRLPVLIAAAALAGCSGSADDPAPALRPDIQVIRAGEDIPNSRRYDGQPSQAIAATWGVPATAAFTVRNAGSATLAFTALSIPSRTNLDLFSATMPMAALAPGASATLAVTIRSDDGLFWSMSVRIDSNDPDEQPFLLNLGGVATPVGAGG
jgi:hypothetical protein